MKEKLVRVLIVSHNALNPLTNNGKTLTSLFGMWEKSSLAQLYFNNELPNFSNCNNYYKLTDFDIIKSFFSFHRKAIGKALNTNFGTDNSINKSISNKLIKKISSFFHSMRPVMYFIRNFIWRVFPWLSKSLTKWIENFSPDVIFFQCGDYSFSIDVVLKLSFLFDIPVVVFYGDEYFFIEKKYMSFVQKINLVHFKKSFLKLIKSQSFALCASHKMLNFYKEKFNFRGDVILTPTTLNFDISQNKGILYKFTYFGNLGVGRFKSLIDLGKELKKRGFYIDVFASEKQKKIKDQLIIENGIRYHGYAQSNELVEIINKSEFLLHIESFEPKFKSKTLFSMSTKIADLLASKKLIIAYGPFEISSLQYLSENNVAFCINCNKDISSLFDILNKKECHLSFIDNAYKLSLINHNFQINTNKLYETLFKVANSQ
jgi:glycosyltransferase involved in cell wall biosynthesis